MPTEAELHARLRQAAVEQAARAAEELDALLSELNRLEDFERVCVSDDEVRGGVAARRDELGRALSAALSHWKRVGARLQLVFDDPPRAVAPELQAASEPSGPARRFRGASPVDARAEEPDEPPPAAAREPSATTALETGAGELDADEPTEQTPIPAPEVLPRRPEPRPARAAAPEGRGTLLSFEARADRSSAAPVVERWMPELALRLRALGPPREGDAEHELVFDAAMGCNEWVVFPPEVQRLMAALVTARARRLQAESGAVSPWLDECTARLAAFVERAELGAVPGLGRVAGPVRGSWFEDAEAARDRLGALLPRELLATPDRERMLARIEDLVGEIACAPPDATADVLEQAVRGVREALEAGMSPNDPGLVRVATPLLEALTSVEFRSLARAIQEELAEREEDRTDAADPVPLDWPWWGHTRDKRAIIVGGTPRELPRLRLERAFEFRSLEWYDADRAAVDLASLRARVTVGDLDMVVIHARFVAHEVTRVLLPACREHGVDWVSVDHGHGVERIRRAIERFTDPQPFGAGGVAVRRVRSGNG